MPTHHAGLSRSSGCHYQLIRDEDAVGREFADWQAESGTPDRFIPSNADAFERYLLRERLMQWTQESEDSWAALDAQRRAIVGAAIEARLLESGARTRVTTRAAALSGRRAGWDRCIETHEKL